MGPVNHANWDMLRIWEKCIVKPEDCILEVVFILSGFSKLIQSNFLEISNIMRSEKIDCLHEFMKRQHLAEKIPKNYLIKLIVRFHFEFQSSQSLTTAITVPFCPIPNLYEKWLAFSYTGWGRGKRSDKYAKAHINADRIIVQLWVF